MLIYAGIDEAGYGPMLGPLCVGAAVLVFDDIDPASGAPDAWSMLDGAICRRRRDKHHRIAIDDSKRLKSAGHGPPALRHLERGVLAFHCAMAPDGPVAQGRAWTDTALLDALGATAPSRPWSGETARLPLSNDLDALRIDGARLRRTLAECHARCDWIACRSIDAGTFNDRTDLESKAAVNFATAMTLVEAIIERSGADHPRILIDRHGGRLHYRQDLQRCFGDARIQVLAEDQALSRYRLRMHSGAATITFASASDRRHLPVALASMIAKYVRELHMLRLNRWFTKRMPDLRPTAGYIEDGRRWIEDVEPLLASEGLERRVLVRNT